MYYSGQIVWNLDAQAPVQVGNPDGGWTGHNGMRTTHFIEGNPELTTPQFVETKPRYTIALPKTIEEAAALMREGRIMPAPVPYTHCTKCMNWLSNHNKDGSCWTKEK